MLMTEVLILEGESGENEHPELKMESSIINNHQFIARFVDGWDRCDPDHRAQCIDETEVFISSSSTTFSPSFCLRRT